MLIPYLAGLVDGEGCVGYHSCGCGGGKKRFVIEIKMTEKHVIEALHEQFGGAFQARPSTNPKWKDQWRWRIQGVKAKELYKQLEPYLLIK